MLLRKAINEDDFDLAAFCIALGFPLDEDGLTNLMILTAKNEIEKVSIFASNYCDPNKVNKNGENCFWIAASKEFFEISTLLYEKYNANPDIISNSGQTLMHIAYEKGDHELLYYLLDLGASPNILNHEKETVQFKAFLKRDFENAEIIQNNFNGDINVKDKNGNTLGHIAILENDISFLRYLIKRKINVENKDNFGRSLFMLAIEKLNDISVLQLLLDNGANINTIDNDDNTPFYFICLEKNFNRSKFNFLLKNKFNTYIKSRWNLHSEALAYLNSLNK